MRTDSFSKEKHLPVRRFIADESKVATGLYGPRAIADDLDNIFNMFDPEATFLDGGEQGGISGKNMQNGAVSFEKLGEDVKRKFHGLATEEQLSSLRTEFTEKNASKAEKSTSLSGYGITDAYTKSETDGFMQGINTAMLKKKEESVLCEDVINTPVWSIQPTYDGVLDSRFNTKDFYYVTLKDAEGNALPSGQFMLKDSYTETATVYDTVFVLPSLHTGIGTLSENFPVELTSNGSWRDAGIVSLNYTIPAWSLENDFGSIRTVIHGEFIQRSTNGYFYPLYTTNKNVESYHSLDGTQEFQSSSTKQIIPYTAMVGTAFPDNRIFDDCILERNGNGYFSLKRFSVIKYGGNRVKFQQSIGYGNTLSANTNVGSVTFRVNNVGNGLIRNGSVIRITEVK